MNDTLQPVAGKLELSASEETHWYSIITLWFAAAILDTRHRLRRGEAFQPGSAYTFVFKPACIQITSGTFEETQKV